MALKRTCVKGSPVGCLLHDILIFETGGDLILKEFTKLLKPL